MSAPLNEQPGKRRGFCRRLAFAVSCALAFGFAGMWVAGMFTYTSVGVDRDEVQGDRVLASYYRVRWPGDGSFWIGAAAHYRLLNEKPPQAIDLGGTLFGPATRPAPQSFWNRLGFQLVGSAAEDPFAAKHYPGAVWSGWVAAPGWLPALLFAAWPVARFVRRRRRR